MWSSLPRTLAAAAARRHTTIAASSSSSRSSRRTFLSEAYRSPDQWNARLQTPILQRCTPDSFYYEVENRFAQQGKCSAIDIDIFANALTDDSHTDELADLMHKLRMTDETTNTLDSTGHAVCRLYLEHVADIHDLLAILDDRLSYGVFLDAYTANLALDRLIRAREFTAAARIATFMMLQESLDGEITRALALFACVKYAQSPQTFDRPLAADPAETDPALAVQSDAKETAAKPTGAAAKKKKVEEVRVRVKFLRNEFFDDHFDLRDAGQLVGKTMAMIGRQLISGGGGAGADAVGNSAQLWGLWHYGKYAEAKQLAGALLQSGAVHADVVKSVAAAVEATAEPSAEVQALGEQLQALAGRGDLVTDDFEKAVSALANSAVQSNESAEIEAQNKVHFDQQ